MLTLALASVDVEQLSLRTLLLPRTLTAAHLLIKHLALGALEHVWAWALRLTFAGLGVEPLVLLTCLLNADTFAGVRVVVVSVLALGVVLGAGTLTGMVVIVLALGAGRGRVGTLALAGICIEVLPS